MRALQRMQRAVREQRYRISSHANEEMSEDNLVSEDVENAILRGRITRKFTRDPRGTRYELMGDTTDGRQARIVCRFLPSGMLLVITAYEDEE
jgi:hypothetical protein